jgi:hypothetical protein
LVAIDTLTNTVVANVPIGQTPQAVTYVPNAVHGIGNTGNAAMTKVPVNANLVPEIAGAAGLHPIGVAGHFTMVAAGGNAVASGQAQTSVTLFDQGLIQVLEASVTGLEPMHRYVRALASRADGSGSLEPPSTFITNLAGSAIVNAIGSIRQIVQGEADLPRRCLVIVPASATEPVKPVQVQVE